VNPKGIPFQFFLLLALCAGSGLRAQTVNLGDSLRHHLSGKPGLVLKTDGRSSFITGAPARIYGVKAGVSFNGRVSLGIGYNWLGKGIQREVDIRNEGITSADLRYHALAPFFEYIFYRRNQIVVSVPVQLGFGFSSLRYTDSSGQVNTVNRGFMLVYEPAMTVEHTFLTYFALGAGVGYRLVLFGNKAIDDRFNSPIYLIRFKVDFKALYEDFGGKERD